MTMADTWPSAVTTDAGAGDAARPPGVRLVRHNAGLFVTPVVVVPAEAVRLGSTIAAAPAVRSVLFPGIGIQDAIIMLCVLQIIFRHDAVARTLRIARQRGVFVGDLLRGATDLHIRTVAFKAARERIRTLAVVVVAAASAHAPVLLLWPHSILCFSRRLKSAGEDGRKALFSRIP